MIDRRVTTGMGGDEAVVGEIDRDCLSAALAAVHRAGFGAQTRVLAGARGDLTGQLRRAGFPAAVALSGAEAATALILVAAPGRLAAARDLLEQAGAKAVFVVRRGTHVPPAVMDAPPSIGGEMIGHLDDAGL